MPLLLTQNCLLTNHLILTCIVVVFLFQNMGYCTVIKNMLAETRSQLYRGSTKQSRLLKNTPEVKMCYGK